MSVDLSRTEPRRPVPHVDPDLPSGRAYGYRDPWRDVRVTLGAVPRKAHGPRAER